MAVAPVQVPIHGGISISISINAVMFPGWVARIVKGREVFGTGSLPLGHNRWGGPCRRPGSLRRWPNSSPRRHPWPPLTPLPCWRATRRRRPPPGAASPSPHASPTASRSGFRMVPPSPFSPIHCFLVAWHQCLCAGVCEQFAPSHETSCRVSHDMPIRMGSGHRAYARRS